MKGSIIFRKDRKIWVVKWYDKPSKKRVSVYRYKGELMYHRKVAEKLLAIMQGDYENGTFRIEKYTKKQWTDVVPYLWEWYNVVEVDLAPATSKGYKSYIRNHLAPFFEENPFQLHEIQYDILMKLLHSIKLSGKGKANVMYCLRTCLDYAWRSRRIDAVPPFPQKKHYQLQDPVIKWLPEERQMNIIEQIPVEHQPIFYFLKYHLRRPSEALALHREDYDPEQRVFTIRRAVSARKVINRTKTKQIHIIPCHSDFEPYLNQALRTPILSPFLFTCQTSRSEGKRYSNEILNRLWKKACIEAGEDIDLYSGLKHSSCSQYINEKGLSESELQIITDHARLDSVKKYAKTEVSRMRELMESRSKVVPFDRGRRKNK